MLGCRGNAMTPVDSIFAVCAEAGGVAIGVGSRLVRALTERVEGVPYIPVEGTADFDARFGDKAQRPTGPAMYRWLNRPPG